MYALGMKTMFSFLRKTALWIALLPFVAGFTGAAANQAVSAANHGRFPVLWNDYVIAQYALKIEVATHSKDQAQALQAKFDQVALQNGFLDDEHVLMTNDTHLNFLADWISLGSYTYSLGDGLLAIAEQSWKYMLLLWSFVAINKLRKQQ